MQQENYCLARDSTGILTLVKAEEPETGQKETVLKAGFPITDKESDQIIFSPTLCLNADMASFSQEELKRIALCEKFRTESLSVRSYLRVFEPSVAVLSSDQDFIDGFLSIYSGVLRLLPIRLETKSSISFSLSEEGRLTIEYQRPLPLDPSLCSMCRQCVSVCKEEAILSSPEIDLESCSLCGDCVGKCPRGAIDLHRLECVREEADLVVKDKRLSLPVEVEFEGRFFTTDTLPILFSKIGTFQVEEAVVHQVEYCAFVPRLDLGCKRCLAVCPEGAIKTGPKGIWIDQARCKECGRCVSICPTGAMSYERFNDPLFFKYFSKLYLDPGLTLVIGTQNVLKEFWWKASNKRFEMVFFLEHPQPASLGPVHFIYLFCLGFKRVVIVSNDTSLEKDPVGQHALFINNILKRLSLCEKNVFPIEFCASGELESFLMDTHFLNNDLKQGLNIPGLSGVSLGNRRKLLNQLLRALVVEEFSTGRQKTVSKIQTDFFATASVNEDCSVCLACLNVCNQEALQVEEADELRLVFNGGLCINCKACEEICPERALSLTPDLVLANDFFSYKILAKDDVVKCKRCGKVFGNKKSFERTVKILRDCGRYTGKELEVLFMCEECRAVAMMEDALGE